MSQHLQIGLQSSHRRLGTVIRRFIKCEAIHQTLDVHREEEEQSSDGAARVRRSKWLAVARTARRMSADAVKVPPRMELSRSSCDAPSLVRTHTAPTMEQRMPAAAM
jgi:hypothetical protein